MKYSALIMILAFIAMFGAMAFEIWDETKLRYVAVHENYCTYVEYHCSKADMDDWGVYLVLTNREKVDIPFGYGGYRFHWRIKEYNKGATNESY